MLYLVLPTAPPHPLGKLDSAPELRDLMNEIAAEIPDKWKEVGIGLGLATSDIKRIETDIPTHKSFPCYMEVFHIWKTNDIEAYTWGTVLKTLRTKLVNAHGLARTLESRLTK